MFERWTCWHDSTWAFRLFKAHHTQLNAVYWAQMPAIVISNRHARNFSRGDLTAEVFSLHGADSRRPARTLDEWKGDYRESENWLRMSAVMSLASYVEIYLRTVVTLALESDPGVCLGQSRVMDGIVALKRGLRNPLLEHVDGAVRGPWNERSRHYHRLFGHTPHAIETNLRELDALRRMRNSVGHMFGRHDDDYASFTASMPKPSQRVSDGGLRKWLGIAEAVALAVDEHLRTKHIGSFEMLRQYHLWEGKSHDGPKHEARRLAKSLGAVWGAHPDRNYLAGLISHYRAA